MKKRYFLEIICFVILLVLPFFRVEQDASFETLKDVIEPYVLSEIMENSDEAKLYRNYHVGQEMFDECLSYAPISYMNVEEITIFKVKDENKRKVLLKASQEHIKQQLSVFEGYGINQCELLDKAVVEEKGSYVIVVVHQESKIIEEKIKECFK